MPSLGYWQANVAAHEYGMSLLKPGACLCGNNAQDQ